MVSLSLTAVATNGGVGVADGNAYGAGGRMIGALLLVSQPPEYAKPEGDGPLYQ